LVAHKIILIMHIEVGWLFLSYMLTEVRSDSLTKFKFGPSRLVCNLQIINWSSRNSNLCNTVTFHCLLHTLLFRIVHFLVWLFWRHTSAQRHVAFSRVIVCWVYGDLVNPYIRPSQTAAFPTFAANRKDVLNLSSQEDLVPN